MKGIFIAALVALGIMGGWEARGATTRPLIRDESITQAHFGGAWGFEYQYYVNGELCVAFVRAEDMDAYRAYLGKFGRFE